MPTIGSTTMPGPTLSLAVRSFRSTGWQGSSNPAIATEPTWWQRSRGVSLGRSDLSFQPIHGPSPARTLLFTLVVVTEACWPLPSPQFVEAEALDEGGKLRE